MTKYITIPEPVAEEAGGGAVDSVNGQTGVVSLDADDISDSSTTNKYATAANIGAIATGVAAKTTPVDADTMPLNDSAASNALKKVTWANIKATLKTYLDTLYQPLASVLTNTTASFTTALETKLNGIEASADVTDAANVDAAGATMNTDSSLAGNSYFLDEDSFASDSATKVPSQQSTKAYVDAQIIGAGSGDVVGPSSSVDSEVALFNSTTGKLIKRATATGIAKLSSGVLSTTSTLGTSDIADAAITAAKLATPPSRFVAKSPGVEVLNTDPANTTFTDLDVTASTSTTAYAVTGTITYSNGATVRNVHMRVNGDATAQGAINQVFRSPIASVTATGRYIIGLDADQIFEWSVSNADVTSIIIVVDGYWETVA